MREIKFRGQTRRKGKKVRLDGTPVEGNWVYGGVKQGKGDFSIIYEDETYDKKVVYTDTVCQYTGLTDKNGNKIYENDIVRCKDLVEKRKFKGVVKYDNCSFYIANSFLSNYRWMDYEVEVIGNIFDNPELLYADNEASKQAHQEVMMPAT